MGELRGRSREVVLCGHPEDETRHGALAWVRDVRKYARPLAMAAALLAGGCSTASGNGVEGEEAGLASLPPTAGSVGQCVLERRCPLPSRAEAVALADQIAIAATRKPLVERAVDARLSGELRQRSYRAYHAAADAREAIEQFRVATQSTDAKAACEAAQAMVALQAELDGDLMGTYGRAYAGARAGEEGDCAASWQRLQQLLEAYRPTPAKLAEIEQKARDAARGKEGDAGAGVQGAVARPPDAAKLGPAQIQKIEAFGAKDAARVVIHLNGPASYQVGHLEASAQGGARLYIDLAKTSRGKVPLTRAVGGLVERVRLGSHQGSTRVVLDLNGTAYRRVFFLPEPFRVIADLTTRAPVGPAEGTPAQARARVERVVIDPGHGGNDPGATGPGGLKEKDVTLDIAHRVAPVLARELGIVTMLTRDVDRYVALEERAARANAFHADLFVSIHCNASESPASRGVQSYVLDASRDESSQRVAARENMAPASAQIGDVVTDLRSGHLSGESVRLADLLQRTTMASLAERFGDTPNGGVKAAGFYVLLGAEMPSVLFEVSFISNPTEEARLATADYRQKIADGIANAVRAYRDGK